MAHLRLNIIKAVRALAWRAFSVPILSHGLTFPEEAPPDLLSGDHDLCGSCHAPLLPRELSTDLLEVPPNFELSSDNLRAYTRGRGTILEITVPIGGGELGSIRLGVSDGTVETHRTNIMSKLDLRSRAELVRFAIDNGLLKSK